MSQGIARLLGKQKNKACFLALLIWIVEWFRGLFQYNDHLSRWSDSDRWSWDCQDFLYNGNSYTAKSKCPRGQSSSRLWIFWFTWFIWIWFCPNVVFSDNYKRIKEVTYYVFPHVTSTPQTSLPIPLTPPYPHPHPGHPTQAYSSMIYSISGLILGLRPANEKWRYFVTTSLIGWVQAQYQP